MLQELHIENFALIHSLRLTFAPGLNVLTGETGAGKSILIEALRIALGGRIQPSQIRDATQTCRIQALFAVEKSGSRLRNMLRDYAEDGDALLIFCREIFSDGRSKLTVNGKLVTLSIARELGECLLNIHGQHDPQRIFEKNFHGKLLDSFLSAGIGAARFLEIKNHYESLYRRYAAYQETRRQFFDHREVLERELDLLRFQITEIEALQPEEGELEALQLERIKLANAGRLKVFADKILDDLDDGEDSASLQIASAFRPLGDWTRLDPEATGFLSRLEQTQMQLEELLRDIRHYRDELTFEPEKLDEVQDRIQSLERLVKKYALPGEGDILKRVLLFFHKAKLRRDELLASEEIRDETLKEIQKLQPELQETSRILTGLRQKGAKYLCREIQKELADLGFQQTLFECRLAETDFGSAGRDQVEFFLSANPGQAPLPLVEVASGGEAARILLALKKTLAAADETPSMIFDEIDSNIGGRLGHVLGEKIRAIAEHHQVLLITHLPQIASYASRHIQIQKKIEGQTTLISCSILEGEARVRELSQMMAGSRETEISKTHAEELIKLAGSGTKEGLE